MRYTMFDVSFAKGLLLAEWGNYIPRHWKVEVGASPDGQKVGIFAYRHAEDTPAIVFETNMRQSSESNHMWRERLKQEVAQAWKKYQDEVAAFVASLKAAPVAEAAPAADDPVPAPAEEPPSVAGIPAGEPTITKKSKRA